MLAAYAETVQAAGHAVTINRNSRELLITPTAVGLAA
jgi:hypothetical protein